MSLNPTSALVTVVSLLFGVGCGTSGVAPCSTQADCSALDDDNRCNGTFACLDGSCRFDPASRVACDPTEDTFCRTNQCAPATGVCAMTAAHEGAMCDDGEPCTAGDRCTSGVCKAGATELCDCRVDEDCSGDGDACNGVEVCDLQRFPHGCTTKPDSAVVCPDDGKPCTEARCDPKTGLCSQAQRADGEVCDDGDLCTLASTCSGGVCVGTQSTCGCKQDSDCAHTDLCAGKPVCDTSGGEGVCKVAPGTSVTCSTKADTTCRKNQCQAKTGVCTLTPVEGACDDGEPCTQGDICVGGSCLGGTDTCVCTSDKDCADSDDGDLCNGVPFCNKATGKCAANPGSAVVCQTVDDTECTKHVCQPKTGTCAALPRSAVKLIGCVDIDLGGGVKGTKCLWAPGDNGAGAVFACNDGDPCTSGDTCAGTLCKPGKTVCACTKDSDCPDVDGDMCTGVPFCDGATGQCKPNPASVVYCSNKGDTACEKAKCNPLTGACALKPVVAKTSCDDGKPCTASDACDGNGVCVGGAKPSCDDKDPCTTDVCDPKLGCVHTAKGCDDGNSCTVDACAQATGQCAHTKRPEGYVCNADDSGCTVGDACKSGACVAGPAKVCAGAAGPCQYLTCISTGASTATCNLVAKPEGTACPDAKGSCLVGATCSKGTCKPGSTQRLYVKAVGPTTGGAGLYDVALLPSGDAVAVGAQWVDSKAKSAGQAWWITRLGADGESVWSTTNKAAQPATTDRATKVVVTADGVIWVAGSSTVGGKPTAELRRYTSAKAGLGSVAAVAGAVGGLAAVPQGGAVMAINTVSAGKPAASLRRYAADGSLTWTKTVAGSAEVFGVAAAGATVLVQVRDTSSQTRWGLEVRKEVDGAAVIHALSETFLTDIPVAVTARAAGYALLRAGAGGTARLRLVDTDGYLTRAAVTTSNGGVTDVAARSTNDGLLVVGSRYGVGFLGTYDRYGNAQWHRKIFGTTALHGVVARGDDLVAVGTQTSKGATLARVVRAGPFGQTSCGGFGGCASKSLADCDDGKACTSDSCDEKVGCQHNAPAGFACQAKDGCSRFGACAVGVCKSAVSGRRYSQPYAAPNATGTAAEAVRELPGGKTRLWFVHGAQVDHVDYDAFGASAPSTSESLCKGFGAVSRVLPRHNGGLLVVGEKAMPSPTNKVAVHCFVDGKGAPLTSDVVEANTACSSPPCWSTTRWADEAKDGSLFTVGTLKLPGPKLHYAGFVEKLSAKGKHVWTAQIAQAQWVGTYGVRGLSDGAAAVVGRIGPEGARSGYIAVVQPDKKLRFLTAVAHDKEDIFRSVVQLNGGTLVGAGSTGVKDKLPLSSFLAAVEPVSGKLLWKRVAPVPDLADFAVGHALADGGAIFGGGTLVYGQRRGLLTRVDLNGDAIWRHEYLVGATQLEATAVSLATWPGGYLVGARVWQAGQTMPGLIKVDAGGYAGCAAAGECVAKKTADCDDKNPCTSDWCDAEVGCRHRAIAGCSK